MEFSIHTLGDFAFVVRFPNSSNLVARRAAASLARHLDSSHTPPSVVECVAASGTMTIFCDPLAWRAATVFKRRDVSVSHSPSPEDFYNLLRASLDELTRDDGDAIANNDFMRCTIELPVCYGGEFGADLEFVARHTRLAPEQVIELHTGGDYIVEMIGFAPGFPYLGGLSPLLATPRRATPRLKVARGSVGIGGTQTCVYSIASPGGWQLIGRTPVSLFRPQVSSAPSLLRAGDRVRFRSITPQEFEDAHEIVTAQE